MANDPTTPNLQTDYALDFTNASISDDDEDTEDTEDPTGRRAGTQRHISNQEMFVPFQIPPALTRVVRGGNRAPEDHVLTTPGEATITPREQRLPRLK